MSASGQLASLFRTYREQGSGSGNLQEMFEHAFNLSPVPTAIANTDDRIVASNQSFLDLVGSKSSGTIGLKLTDFVDPSDQVSLALKKLLASKSSIATSVKIKILNSDGVRICVTAVVCPLPTGNFAYYFSL